ncbi:MAG: CPBP family intramembrane metalloprotease [Betaproteobacteria bacterium]|nr:CPBP family intramembrane metalloprotease [Betaproteobacteria bacterium]
MKIFFLLTLGFAAIKLNALFAQRTFDRVSYDWSAIWTDTAVLVGTLLWVYALRKIVGRERGPIDFQAPPAVVPSKAAMSWLTLLGVVIAIGAHSLFKWPSVCEGDAAATMQRLGLLTPEGFAQRMAATHFIDYIPYVLAACVLTPIAEEIVFRREALGYLLRTKTIPMAIGIQAGIFGLFHFSSVAALVDSFIFAIMLGAIQMIAKDVRIPIIVHGIYNLSLITPIHGRIFATKDPAQLCSYQAWLPEIVSVSLAIPAGIFLVVWLYKSSRQELTPVH